MSWQCYPFPKDIADEIMDGPPSAYSVSPGLANEMKRLAAGLALGGIKAEDVGHLVAVQIVALDKPFLGTLNRARSMLAALPTRLPAMTNEELYMPSSSASAQGVTFIPSGNSDVRGQARARIAKLDVLLVNMDEQMLGVEVIRAVLTAFHRRFHLELGGDKISPDMLVRCITWVDHVLSCVNETLRLTRMGRENKPLQVHMRMLESFLERQIKKIWDEL